MIFTDEFRNRLHGVMCVYCGDIATQDEHFPPASCTRFGYILPCCGECNRIAGTQHPYNFTDRYEYVNRKLRKKYKRQLKVEDWEDKELAEVSYRLRIYILKWQKIKEWLRKRVAWNVIAYLSSIDRNKSFVEILAEPNIIIEEEKILLKEPEKVSKIIKKKKEIPTFSLDIGNLISVDGKRKADIKPAKIKVIKQKKEWKPIPRKFIYKNKIA
jgi:hypothetical protein